MSNKLPFFATIGNNLGKSVLELYKSLALSLWIDVLWFIGYTPIFIVVMMSIQALPQTPKPQDVFQAVTLFLSFFCIWHSLVAGPLVTSAYTLYQERKLEYPSVKMYWQGLKKFYWRSVAIYGVFSLVCSLLVMNIILAFNFHNFLFLASGIVSLYVLLFILMMSFYFNPLIYLDNPFKKVIHKAFLLVMDNFLISFGFVLVFGIFVLLCIKFLVLIFILTVIYGPLLTYFTDLSFEAVYGRYDS